MLMRTTTANPALDLDAGAETPNKPQCPAEPQYPATAPSGPVRVPVGSIVGWTTYRHGSGAHTGIVAAFVPAGEAVLGFYPWTAKEFRLGDFAEIAAIDRYLMRIERPGKMPRYLCPPAVRIEKAFAAGQKQAEHAESRMSGKYDMIDAHFESVEQRQAAFGVKLVAAISGQKETGND